ncbi:MAG: hypothetical protein LWX07_08195 [Bacteroidetes bacterium]|nr:hypothetical protein [Bacteroidota bacterium]
MNKKHLLILPAFIIAFIAVEILIGNLLGFPKYGVLYKMKGMRASAGHQNVYKPYSEYWNLKEKFEIYRRNNLGLPGANVNVSESAKYVCVLGSSFIENMYISPELMSTTVFQNKLRDDSKMFSVLNLGYNGYDPYDCLRRMVYYESAYKPECVMLVINSYKSDSYLLIENPFDINPASMYIDNSFKSNASIFLRNNSAFIRLVSLLFQEGNEQTVLPSAGVPPEGEPYLTDLEMCLNGFFKRYGNRFVCVSIMNNGEVNRKLDQYCKDNNINFEYSDIMTPENQIEGDWHLNTKGNAALGNFLYESYRKHFITGR